MTNLSKIKTSLFIGAAAVTLVATGTALTINAQESNKSFVSVKGDKPLDNLGEIADKPKTSTETKKTSLYDKDEKVGEAVSLENLTRLDKLGNSNKEFDNAKDAETWAETKLEEGKIESYMILPIFWSDKHIHSYTVEVKFAEEVSK